ncbi:MAG TPA: glutamate-5-semialdehyde dehydrogenase [Oscillospiraceae bacterium]|nr:glutamate-5-semialdehyde dehydrogenase [Oscillospiraceae bacterium]HPF56503.1 glutamate-5-semialdehyde dehydrogenase [Clostridiales bacterium]HPK34519.1 glutamate-5-semialdehyde dehydrogenase [Oscillospiraceae bacterium]HPR74747.1 glutamate-5-semialdehyde dehydrogenase [Oscillospiraceae bacterium]
MEFSLEKMCTTAKRAAAKLAVLGSGEKNRALAAMRALIDQNRKAILDENVKDVEDAKKSGMRVSLIDRLTLTDARIDGICKGMDELMMMPDPVGVVLGGHVAENGLKITKVSVPIGVIGVIFEARPNVCPDVAALCLKSGNVCILRGGKEALRSNTILASIMRNALESVGLDPNFINLIPTADREIADEFLKQDKYLDCMIPRGGAGLIQAVRQKSSVPVIETGAGICSVYIDKAADLEKAVKITDNAKTSRPSVCNAAEILLCHRDIAKTALPAIKKALDGHQVQLRCCAESYAILKGDNVVLAGPEDYDTEFGDMIMAVKIVGSIDEAIVHITAHDTRHSEAIITENLAAAEVFLNHVDAAAVYVNASTRFTDGGCFGLGAEIGISTQKLHARGPMGLTALTSYKYTVVGDGQIR